MTISLTLAVATARPLPSFIKSKSRPSAATIASGGSSSYYSSERADNICLKSNGRAKKHIRNMVIGLLAASVLALSPLEEANATRIEYYATVAEPSCVLNFVRSGLGYCDIAVGAGEQPPYNELIDVHYTARFSDGIVFDSSFKRGRPLTMRIGVGKILREKIN